MYTEKLKEIMGGVIGSFIVKDGELQESDLETDLRFVIQNIYYIMEAVNERRNFRELLIVGEKNTLFVYVYLNQMVGVLLDRIGNTSLLSFMIRKTLEMNSD